MGRRIRVHTHLENEVTLMAVAPVAKPGVRVCVLSVDSPHGFGGELQRSYHTYKTPAVALLFAGKFAQQMEDEGFASIIRGVFVEQDGEWKTVGSYFDAR